MRNVRELILILAASLPIALLVGAAGGDSAAKRAVCGDNLRQLVRLAHRYAADHDDFIIPAYVIPPQGSWKFWPLGLQDYVEDFAVFYCPADSRKRGLARHDLLPTMFAIGQVGYGINREISGTVGPKSPIPRYKFARIARPEYVVAFGDARALQLRPTRGCWTRDWNPVHDRGANYVMADGHVEYFSGRNPGLADPLPGWPLDKKRWRDWK